MEKNDPRDNLAEHYAIVSPDTLSNDELAYAVIYSLTSMDQYDLSDDEEYDDDDYDYDDEDDENPEYDEEDAAEKIEEAYYEASFLFWKKRCNEFQFELWQRGFEAIRVRLCENVYIPVLQQRGYNMPIEMLISNFCKKCSIEQLESLINLLAMEDNAEARAAATPFVTERQIRLN